MDVIIRGCPQIDDRWSSYFTSVMYYCVCVIYTKFCFVFRKQAMDSQLYCEAHLSDTSTPSPDNDDKVSTLP